MEILFLFLLRHLLSYFFHDLFENTNTGLRAMLLTQMCHRLHCLNTSWLQIARHDDITVLLTSGCCWWMKMLMKKSDGRVMIQGQPPTNPPTALIVTLAHHHLTPRTIHLHHPNYTLKTCITLHLTPPHYTLYTRVYSYTPALHTPLTINTPALYTPRTIYLFSDFFLVFLWAITNCYIAILLLCYTMLCYCNVVVNVLLQDGSLVSF